jgi:hypothetical protein
MGIGKGIFTDKGAYSIGQYTYPENNSDASPDLKHFVNFYINIRSGTNFNYDVNKTVTPRSVQGLADKGLNEESLKRAIEITAGAAVIGAGAAAIVNLKNGAYKSGFAAAAAGTKTATLGALAIGLTVGAIEGSDGILKNDNKQRLSDVISLAIQERPSVSYGVNYQDKDMGILGGFLTDVDSSSSMAGAAALLQMAKLPSIIPGFAGGSPADLVSLASKAKTNPFREVLFEGVDYRKFNFKYKFMPKNKNESEKVRGIISLFKEHMHPELAGDGFFYIYPSEFEIEYKFNGQENGYFNRIANCVLTDMTVDYGGDQFASFNNGAPSEINLTLSFRELELLTKDTIKAEGF